MCTLSWQIHDTHLSLMFNRDELLSRPEAFPPIAYESEGTRYLAPIDSKAGGTWLSVNEKGLVLALLNNYTVSQIPVMNADIAFKSRGHLVRKLAGKSTVREVMQTLHNENLNHYQPFDFFVFSGIRQPHQWSWDGSFLREIIAPTNPAVSSSLHLPVVKKIRSFLFRKITKKGLNVISEEEQLAFHQKRIPLLAAYSTAMKRSDRASVSITHIRIGQKKIQMRYKSGDVTNPDKPFSSQELPLKDKLYASVLPKEVDEFPGIDFRKILLQKNKAVHDSLPGWIFPVMRKVIMQKTINRVIRELKGIDGRYFPQTILNYLKVSGRLHTQSFAMPPADSRPLFVANHPTGGLDGLLMMSLLLQYYPSSKMVVNDILGHIPQLRSIIVPVDLYNHSRNSAEVLHKAFASDDALLIFPAGRTGRIRDGIYRDFRWNKMPVRLAKEHGRTIVPVYINSRNSWKFNTVAFLRTYFGIKLNLEMMLLAREFIKPAQKTFDLFLGEPMKPELVEKLADRDSDRAYRLQKINEEIRTAYMKEMVV